MSWISPEEFEISYRKKENQLYLWLSQNCSFIVMALACAALFFLARYTNDYFYAGHFKYYIVGAFGFIRNFHRKIWIVLIFGVLSPFVPRRFQSFYQFCVAMTLTLMIVPVTYKHTDLNTMLVCGSLLPLVLILSWIFLSVNVYRDVRWMSTIIYSVVFWSLFALGAYWLHHHHYHVPLRRFWQLRLQFIWISMLVLVWLKKISAKDTKIAFMPVNAIRGILWPYDLKWEEEETRRRKIWWNGYCNLLLGFSVLLFRIWLERNPLVAFRVYDPTRISGHVLTILSDIGALNLISGTARLFGYGVRDATNFVFLARTPADIWRRSSTYNYLFVLRCVYMPLFKVWHNFFFASFVAFLVFFINHHGLYNFAALFLHITQLRPVESKLEIFRLAVFSLHFLAIFFLLYFSRRWWFFRWRDMHNPKIAWASIALTHVLRIAARSLSWALAMHFFWKR